MKEYYSNIKDSKIDDTTTVVHPVNIYGADIKASAFIGPFVEIQKGVTIGEGSRISSHSFLCEGVHIGDNVFVAHGVMFINDKNPAANNPDWVMQKTVIENNVSIGSNATILPVKIGKGATIGAGAVVTKDVPPYTTVIGNPARILGGK